MKAGLAVGAAFVVGGMIMFASGASGTFSVIQIVLGIAAVVVGGITLKSAAGK